MIRGSLHWLIYANSPSVVVSEDGDAIQKYIDYITVVRLFMRYPKLYSWKYISFMKSELTDLGLVRIK